MSNPQTTVQAVLDDLIATFDAHVGTPEDVIASLQADTILPRVTDLVFQVHSIDPPPAFTLRSKRLVTHETLGEHADDGAGEGGHGISLDRRKPVGKRGGRALASRPTS